jgi:predicted histone-like DNA-binding protein
MKFKIIERKNPQDRQARGKYYAIAINSGQFTIKSVAKEISGRSSLTRGDIENVLTNFLDELPTFLKIGMSVKLGDFGTLRLSLSSEGAETEQEFKTEMIKGAKIIFTPSAELKESLKDIKYEVVK